MSRRDTEPPMRARVPTGASYCPSCGCCLGWRELPASLARVNGSLESVTNGAEAIVTSVGVWSVVDPRGHDLGGEPVSPDGCLFHDGHAVAATQRVGASGKQE